ncbi:ABC transporter ATP-binding protein [Pseudoclavibacter chungangensis]|uniref:ABC transporter ATP-binding protein n=1 Tax=Pseudoclavibacter chungangensis TaxID=587635 RepID=A0A7J5BPG1_9MICO|nr:ABC transporter ATP-binding protein [Pseudoclavibacter chungangensis]KAB1654829.1 ABC transporter ATP-binding protein [Pseudoclavibacter chungangensis]NYJ68048.1 peptide/nickel transport system ATP-binding protein [Pseudoclavibacter chungangensis]
MTAVLTIDDLRVGYLTGGERIDVVRGVSLELEAGKVLAVVGESGSGKTTTAQAATGLLASNGSITGGSVRIDGTDVTGWTDKRFQTIRGETIGWIPQDPNNSLNPVKKIGESVAEVLRVHKWKDREARRARVLELLDRVGIPDPELRAKQYPHQLSGGMKQRVLIASAIALQPRLLIADEATSALDVTVQKTILDLIDELRRESGTAVLMVTHDLAVAADRADELLVLKDGTVQERGETVHVLLHPTSEYTTRLLHDAPAIATIRARETEEIVGPDAPRDPEAAPVVVARSLVQEFGPKRSPLRAVDDVSFEIPAGTTHAIVGESGSGKTTTARIVLGFQRPTSGSVEILGKDITSLRGRGLRELRRSVQMVYQNPYSSLDPRQTIEQIVAEPLRNFGVSSAAERRKRVEGILDRVALPSSMLTRRPRELSGGQRQRVAIARALVLDPSIVVLDEAVSALDVTVQAQILELLGELQRSTGVSYLFISHDLAVVRLVSHTVSVMRQGAVVEAGPTAEVFDAPQDEYTQRLIAAIPGRRAAETGTFLI